METLTSQEIHQKVAQGLAETDVRYTSGRRAVVAILIRVGGPRSVGELVKLLEDSVPVSSLYRSLAIFEEAGVIVKHHDVDGIIRVELSEWLLGHHHHVVCDDCGRVEDFSLSSDEENTLHDIVDKVGESLRYQVSGHVLEVEGVCDTCAP
ncbi:MAG: hypothetical protein GEU79_07325 [Acidimicrobiia bacterium]|nr:hypothetical protein [Acidimicrobiia bacterium]